MKTYEINLYTIEELKNINIKAYNKIIDDTKNELISDRFDFDALYDIQAIFKKHNLEVNNKDIILVNL